MRNNKKKGFTLVELLVVIAILAILATVSVVTYTSYIESTAVRVDRDLAAQLNRFIEAYKVDHRDLVINEDNIDEVTADLLKLGGLDGLDPKAATYGYHFYYDFKEEEYVSLHDDEAITGTASPAAQIAMHVLGYEPANGSTYKTRLGNCFTFEGRYYLVDSTGDLAETIANIKGFSGGLSDLSDLKSDVDALGYSGLSTFVDSTAFITNEGTLVMNTAGNHTYVIVANDITKITNTVVGVQGTSKKLTADKNLIETTDGVVIRLPGNIAEVQTNSLNIGGAASTIIIDEEAWTEETSTRYEAGFTTSNVTIIMGKNRYQISANNEGTLENIDTNESFELKLSAVIDQFDLVVKDMNYDEVDTILGSGWNDNKGYVAWNFGDFELQASEILNTRGETDGEVSSNEIVLSIADELKTYLAVDGSKIKFLDTNGDGNVDKDDYLAFVDYLKTKAAEENKISFTVSANSTYKVVKDAEGKVEDIVKVEDGNYSACPSAEIEIRVLMITEVGKVKIDADNSPLWAPGGNVSFTYSEPGTKFNIIADESTIVYNWPEATRVKLNPEINLSYQCAHTSALCCPHFATNPVHDNTCLVCEHTVHTADCCKHEHSYEECCSRKGTGTNQHSSGEDCAGAGTNYNCCSHKLDVYYKSLGIADSERHTHSNSTCCTQTPSKIGYIQGAHFSNSECAKAGYTCCNVIDMVEVNRIHDANCCDHQYPDSCDETCLECNHNHAAGNCVGTDASCGFTNMGTIINGNVITTNDNCAGASGTLTVTIGNETWGTVNVSFADLTKKPVMHNTNLSNYQNATLGSLNKFTLDKLFQVRTGNALDNQDYYLVVFYGTDLNPANIENLGYGTMYGAPIKVNALTDTIDLSTLESQPQPDDLVYLALYTKNGDVWTRASDDVIVNMVEAYNVDNYDDFKSNIATNNVVLLGNITMSQYDSVSFKNDLYGNCYTFDITKGSNSGNIITINGANLQDLKIVADIYTEFGAKVDTAYGSSAVSATGTSSIINCYIANARAPLYISGGNVTVRDSVLFGGRYANIDHRGGTLTFEGTVTLIQKPVVKEGENDRVVGLGISAWFNDNHKTIELAENAELIQYNFANKDMKDCLPEVMGVTMVEPFDEMFANHKDKLYIDADDTNDKTNAYINTGIFGTDLYCVDYRVIPTRNNSTEDDKFYAKGDILTVKLGPNNSVGITESNTDEFTLTFLSDYLEVVDKDLTVNGGRLTIKGSDLYKGIEFKVIKQIDWKKYALIEDSDYIRFAFRLECPDQYKTLVLDPEFANLGYDPFIFVSNMDARDEFGVAPDTFHNSGIHYGYIVADARTPITHTNRFEEYLTYVLDDHYDPENYGFTDGHLVIEEIESVDDSIVAPDDAQ